VKTLDSLVFLAEFMFNLDLIVDLKLFNAGLKMLNVCLELVPFSFLNQYLIRVSYLNRLFFLFAFGVFVLDLENAE